MDRPETAPCDETQQLDETKQKLWTRSRARACPLTVRARLLSARHHSRARGSSSPSTALCACVRVPLPPFHSALATVAARHLKRLVPYWEWRWWEAGKSESSDGVHPRDPFVLFRDC